MEILYIDFQMTKLDKRININFLSEGNIVVRCNYMLFYMSKFFKFGYSNWRNSLRFLTDTNK